MKYVIQRELLYVNQSKPWSRIPIGTVVDEIPFPKLEEIDRRHFRSVEKTERKKNFNARIFAFEYDGLVRMAVIGQDGKPVRERR